MKSEPAAPSPRPSTDRLDYVDSVRAIAIFMVVATHALGYVELSSPLRLFVSFTVHTIAVPVFFMCDGFLLAHKLESKKPKYRRVLLRSAQRLLLPWGIFSFFYTVARLIFEQLGIVPATLVAGQSLKTVVANVYGSVIAPQMYFLLSLLFIRLLTPVTSRLAHFPGITGVVFLVYTGLFVAFEPSLADIFSYGLDPILHGLWGLQFYLLGILVRSMTARLETWGSVWGPILVILAFGGRFYAPQSVQTSLLVQYAYLFGTFAIFAGMSTQSRFLTGIGKETMGIYLLHTPVLLKFLDLATDPLPAPPLAKLGLVTVAALAISFAISKLLHLVPQGRALLGEMGISTRRKARAHRL